MIIAVVDNHMTDHYFLPFAASPKLTWLKYALTFFKQITLNTQNKSVLKDILMDSKCLCKPDLIQKKQILTQFLN